MSLKRWISDETEFLEVEGPIHLENGSTIPQVRIAFRTWGHPRPNATLVCHALTGSADADDWWAGLFGPGRAHIVDIQALLLDHLGIETLDLVVGGSMGGMQVLEWAALYPNRVTAIAPIAATATQSAWAIGLSEAQRQAIEADADFADGFYPLGSGPARGLAAARSIAMLSYRSPQSFQDRFGREQSDDTYAVQSYLRHQGAKLVSRFDANTYLTLLGAMDSHDLGRGRGPVESVLRSIEQPALVVSVGSDGLYPASEVAEMASHLPNAELHEIDAPHGHDAFLIHIEELNDVLVDFIERHGLRRTLPEVLAR